MSHDDIGDGRYGFYWSHTVVELLNAGYDVVIADNLCNSKVEVLLHDFARQRDNFRFASLRYFNPVGAHPSGLIGEDCGQKAPNNLAPYITRTLLGQFPYLSVYGDQYDTADGTGVRDYIHVVDLAKGHIAALNYLEKTDSKYDVFNLGTGKGTTVLQLVSAFEEASGRKVPYRIVGPRAGDVPLSFAAVEKAKNILGWTAEYDYKDCARDSWNWQVQNPNGYIEEG